jgi:hypothetical protein
MKKKTQKTKNFLKPSQVKELEKKKWDVMPKGVRVTLYADEFNGFVWEDYCELAGLNPETTESITLLSYGIIKNL